MAAEVSGTGTSIRAWVPEERELLATLGGMRVDGKLHPLAVGQRGPWKEEVIGSFQGVY